MARTGSGDLPRLRLGLAIVRGRSMEPTYVDGDRLVVLHGAAPRPGRPHVIRLPDGPDGPRPIAVKRTVREQDGGWWVERDNPTQGVDSRTVGAIPREDMLALVLGRLPTMHRGLWLARGGQG